MSPPDDTLRRPDPAGEAKDEGPSGEGVEPSRKRADTGEDATYVREAPERTRMEPSPWTEPTRGMEVGRYVVLKQVGQGGMGVVYAAYDPDLDRKVALKILRPSQTESDAQARARLVREAQAMARVSHPNVCSVFDVGTYGDQVFVAMEFVEGSTLLEWLKQPRPWREVLRVLLKTGRGLLAAHEAGLIHRDFKPANVLLDASGRPRVTDFGVARLASPGPASAVLPEALARDPRAAALFSMSHGGMVVGTPLYMPPEQYLGRGVDARTDQFSFCVVLYQALFGRMPFEPERMAEVARDMLLRSGAAAIPTADVIAPPPRDSKIPAWLRQAVMRGLSLNPEERFPGMKEMLEALSQEPRRARNRQALWAGGLLLGAVAVGAGLIWRQSQVCDGADQLMAEVWNPRVQRSLEASFAGTRRPFAAQVAHTVTQALDSYAQAWIRQSTEACMATREHGVQTEEILSRRVVCLERRRKDLRALSQVFSSADGALVERAVDAVSALPALHECEDVEALMGLRDLPADPARRAELERLQTQLSEVKALMDAGRYKPAQEQVRPLEPSALATGYRPLVAEVRFHLGWLRYLLGEREQAARVLEQAFNDAEAGRADRLKVSILNKLLFVHGNHAQWELAELWGRLALSSLTRTGDDTLLTADVLGNLGNVELARQRLPEARAYLERARALLPPDHPKRVKLTYLLGMTALNQGEGARAEELLGEALQGSESLLGREHPDTARRRSSFAEALRLVDKPALALEHAQQSLEVRRAVLGPKHLDVIVTMEQVGMCLLELARYEESLEIFRTALALSREDVGDDDPGLQFSYDGIGQALVGLGRYAEAVAPLEKAMSFKAQLETLDQQRTLGESGFALARALWGLGQRERARGEAARAREVLTRIQHSKKLAALDAWLSSIGVRPPAPPAP
jgi:tetratricopeptide (TPR) repeat protein/predicted Ser/Thr protein kinase